MANPIAQAALDFSAGKITADEFDKIAHAGPAPKPRLPGGTASMAKREPPPSSKIEEAAFDLMAARTKDLEIKGADPQAAARQAQAEVLGQETAAPRKEDPSIFEAAVRAFTPKVGEAATIPERLTAATAAAKSIAESTSGLTLAQFAARRRAQPEKAGVKSGTPQESTPWYLLRVVSSALEAPGQEAILQAPVPGGGTVESKTLGTTPAKRGLTQGGEGTSFRQYLLRVLQKIERGNGLLNDAEAAAKVNELTPNQTRLAMALGFAGDVLVPWEGPLKLVGGGARAAKFAKTMQEVAPAVKGAEDAASTFSLLRKAISGSHADVGRVVEKATAQAFESGGLRAAEDVAEVFPAPVVQRMNALLEQTGGSAQDAFQRALTDAAPIVTKEPPPAITLTGKLAEKLGPEKPADAMDDFFSSTYLGRFAGDRPPTLTPAQDSFVDLVGETYRSFARESLGDSRLVPMADNTVWVTRAEQKAIKSEMNRLQADAGWSLTGAKDIGNGKVALTPKQVDALEKLNVGGRKIAEEMDADAVNAILADNVKNLAGVSANARNVARGTRALSDFMLESIDSFTRQKKGAEGFGAGLKLGVQDLLEKFTHLDKSRMPRATRTVFERITKDLLNNTADFSDDLRRLTIEKVRAGKEVDSLQLLRQAAGDDYQPVGEAALRVADDITKQMDEIIRGVKSGVSGPKLAALRDQAKEITPHLDANIKGLDSDDPAFVIDALQTWAKERTTAARQSARGLIEAIIQPAVKAARRKGGIKTGRGEVGRVDPRLRSATLSIEEALKDLVPAKDLDAIYREVVLGGDLNGPRLTATLNRIAGVQHRTADDAEVFVRWFIGMRAARLEREAVSKLVQNGLAVVKDSPVGKAASEILRGVPRTQPQHIVDQAWHVLYRSGLEPGFGSDIVWRKGTKFPDVVGTPGLPVQLSRELARARNLGSIDPGKVLNINALNTAVRFNKEVVTHGFVIPNPKFFVTQVLGAPFMMLQNLGVGGTARSLGTMLRHPAMTSSIMARMLRLDEIEKLSTTAGSVLRGAGVPSVEAPTMAGRVFRAGNGQVYTASQLTKVARDFGLNRTASRVENSRKMMEDLALWRPGWFSWMRRKVAGWQGILREMSSGTEMGFRVGVYLDGVKRGVPPQEAARVARDALYDYGKLTPFEQEVMRRHVMFYTFLRKNLDAFMKTLFSNPERVLGQLRFFRDQAHWWGLDERQTFKMGEKDLAKLWLGKVKSPLIRPDGTIDTENGAMLSMTSPIPAPEALFTLYDLANVATFGGVGAGIGAAAGAAGKPSAKTRGLTESAQELAGQLNFLLPTAAEIVTGRDTRGWAVDSYRGNEIPGWMMSHPMVAGITRYLFDPQEIPIKPGRFVPLDAHVNPYHNQLTYWAIDTKAPGGAKRMALWRLIRRFLGRSINTLRDVDRAHQWQHGDPTLLQVGESEGINRLVPPELTDVLGVTTKPVSTVEEAVRRAEVDRARGFRDRTKAINERL